MRNRKLLYILVIVLVILMVVAGAMNGYLYYTRDKEPPVFSYEEEAFFLSDRKIAAIEKGDYTPLLEGVSAEDDRDHDVTDKILIQDYEVRGDGYYAIVTYMVMDSSENMAKGHRILYLKEPREISEAVLRDYFHVDIDQKPEEDISEPPVLRLQDRVTLQVGDTFDPLPYLIELSDDVDSYEELLPNCSAEGYLDVNVSGVYYIAFTATDSDGNQSEPAIVRVEVQE